MSIGNQSYDFIDFLRSPRLRQLTESEEPTIPPLYTSQFINRWIVELFFVFDNISHEVAEYE
jgi:hypothetical protein